jgi:hypothetical protein
MATSIRLFDTAALPTIFSPALCGLTARASAAAKRAQRAKRVGCNRLLASAPFFKTLSRSCVSVLDFYEAHAVTQPYRSVQRSMPLRLAFTFCRVAHSRLRQTRAFGFVNLPARCRVASHAPLCRRSYAECHTAQVVSRDVGFRPAVPLPAVAILSRVLLEQTRLFAFRKA